MAVLRINFEHGRMEVDGKRMTTYNAEGRALWYMDAEEAHEGILLTLPKDSPLLNSDEAPQLLGRALSFTFEEDGTDESF